MMKFNVKLFVDGVFSVYKPPGITSYEVVDRLKSIIIQQTTPKTKLLISRRQMIKVGHGGTLDKGAEGILVIGLGKGCKKLTQYLLCNKTYMVTGILGKTTDTLDGNGVFTEEQPYDHVSRLGLEMVLKSFEGQQCQIPPLYSALKFGGKRASDWARKQGIHQDMKSKSRTVNISGISLKNFNLPTFEAEVRCSSGTYIRSLVRDIGMRLNTVAYVKHLCRTSQGEHDLNTALTQENWTYDCIMSALSET